MIKLKSLFTVLFVLFFFTIGNSQTLKGKKQAFDSELLIAKQGDYYLNNQLTKLPTVKPPIKNHIEEPDSFDYELLITNQGDYYINNKITKISKIKTLFKNHLEESDSLIVKLSLEHLVEYSKIEKLRKSYEKLIDYDTDYYSMTYNELAWNYNKKLDK